MAPIKCQEVAVEADGDDTYLALDMYTAPG